MLAKVQKLTPTSQAKSHSGLCRFLRAVNWASAAAAIKRLEDTLKWRREFGVYDVITASYVEPEVCPTNNVNSQNDN